MERWEYKVVSTDVLVKRSQDHDIAVYKEEADSRRESSRGNLEDSPRFAWHRRLGTCHHYG